MNPFTTNFLRGGTYLVTGASSGIGRAAALKIAESGGKVIVTGRNEERLKQTLSLLALGSEHCISPTEFTDADQTAEWAKQLIAEHGPLSGVFHAAGVEMIRPVRMIKQAQINAVFSSSLYAAFGLAKTISQKNAFIDGGSLVFMSSVAGVCGQSGMTAYSAAKASIEGLVRSLACELAARRIRVNSISAGAIQSEMHERLTISSTVEATADYEKSHLLGFGQVDDVANAVLFLLSDASRWITGSSLAVDGGYRVR
jgi:NAD(P)-dependent dehydrogenase (short-subunit alcohol dehydrogenase family)